MDVPGKSCNAQPRKAWHVEIRDQQIKGVLVCPQGGYRFMGVVVRADGVAKASQLPLDQESQGLFIVHIQQAQGWGVAPVRRQCCGCGGCGRDGF